MACCAFLIVSAFRDAEISSRFAIDSSRAARQVLITSGSSSCVMLLGE